MTYQKNLKKNPVTKMVLMMVMIMMAMMVIMMIMVKILMMVMMMVVVMMMMVMMMVVAMTKVRRRRNESFVMHGKAKLSSFEICRSMRARKKFVACLKSLVR